MSVLTPQFVFDLETRMRVISEANYLDITKNLWWDKVTKVIPSSTRREVITWILNTASIEDQGKGGNIAFDDMILHETEFESKTAGKGLKLRRQQFEDLDGNGVNLAAEWSAQIGAQQAYWPQKGIANLLKTGHDATSLTYDALPFFSASHLLNPGNAATGTFSNLMASLPIDTSVTTDVALANLATVFGNIASIKMPNGTDPRGLRPVAILAPPKLFPRVVQLTNAKFIAQAAATGGGAADVEALIASLGYGMPICADELAGFESDTTYFVIASAMGNTQLGGFVYIDREPFSIRYYTGRGGGTGADAILDRADILEWHVSGRNAFGYGHPFTLFKVKAGA